MSKLNCYLCKHFRIAWVPNNMPSPAGYEFKKLFCLFDEAKSVELKEIKQNCIDFGTNKR
jgi:hypothetical protein